MMANKTVYTITEAGTGEQRSGFFMQLLLACLLLIVLVLAGWYWYGWQSKGAAVSAVIDNAVVPNKKDSLSGEKDTVTTPTTRKDEKQLPVSGKGQQPVSKMPVAEKVQPESSVADNFLTGTVLQDGNNGTTEGAAGVEVYYLFNGQKKSVRTDASGEYTIAVPGDKNSGIDCNIMLCYKKGTQPVKQQLVSCSQKTIINVKL